MNTSPLRTRKSSSKTLGQEYPKALPSPMVSVWHYEKTACLMCYVFGREMRLEEPFSLVHAPSISEAVTQGSSVLWDNEVYSRHIEEGLRVIFTPSSGCALSLTPPTTYPTSPYNHPSNYHYPGGIPSDFEWTYSPASCSASEAMRIFAPGSEIEMIEIVPTACDQFISPTSSSCHTMTTSMECPHERTGPSCNYRASFGASFDCDDGEVQDSNERVIDIQLPQEDAVGSLQTLLILKGKFIKKNVPCEPKKVFSATKLIRYHQKLNFERKRYPQLVHMLLLQEYKILIQLVNDKARSLRERFDSPGYMDNWEQPFKWIDPAEALLEIHEDTERTLVVVSPQPFTIPHIVITGPEPQDDCIGGNNATNDPQDYGFGRWLTVPSCLTNFINAPCDPRYAPSSSSASTSRRRRLSAIGELEEKAEEEDEYYSGKHSGSYYYEADEVEHLDDNNWAEPPSRPETPGPLTPSKWDDDGSLSGYPFRESADEEVYTKDGGLGVTDADGESDVTESSEDGDSDVFVYQGTSTPAEETLETRRREFSRTNASVSLRGGTQEITGIDANAEWDLGDSRHMTYHFSRPAGLNRIDNDTGDDTDCDNVRKVAGDDECAYDYNKERGTAPSKETQCDQWAIDEDQDELPPLDDWYQAVARRANLTIPGPA